MNPSPVPQNVACSACGLSWSDHGENPTLETCVALLKAALAQRPALREPHTHPPQPVFPDPQPLWPKTPFHPIWTTGDAPSLDTLSPIPTMASGGIDTALARNLA